MDPVWKDSRGMVYWSWEQLELSHLENVVKLIRRSVLESRNNLERVLSTGDDSLKTAMWANKITDFLIVREQQLYDAEQCLERRLQNETWEVEVMADLEKNQGRRRSITRGVNGASENVTDTECNPKTGNRAPQPRQFIEPPRKLRLN